MPWVPIRHSLRFVGEKEQQQAFQNTEGPPKQTLLILEHLLPYYIL